MTGDQLAVFVILALTLVLFVWGRWRYDLVALAALLLVFVAGLVRADELFLGFGHPAVVTVAGGRHPCCSCPWPSDLWSAA